MITDNLDYLVDVLDFYDYSISPIALLVFQEDTVTVVYNSVFNVFGVGTCIEEALDDFKDNLGDIDTNTLLLRSK